MDDSKILIIGSKGQLGLALQDKYPKAKAVDSDKLDITDENAVDSFDWTGIEYILNAAGYTNVDGAETEEGKKLAWAVNDQGVSNLCKAAMENDITLVHISTEYVFDGTKDPHSEDEQPTPLSEYGKSKAAGDRHVLGLKKYYLIRTSWVVGEGKNFVRTMLGLAQKGISPTVVSDQIGRLTFASTLASGIDHLLKNKCQCGTYNLSNDGQPASWADIAREVFKTAGYDNLTAADTSTEEYYSGKEGIAPRPLKSTLDLSKIKTAGFSPPDWREELKDYIKTK